MAFASLFNYESSTVIVRLMAMKESDRMVFVDNLVQLMKDRGVDGLFWNAEIASIRSSGMTYTGQRQYAEFLHYLDTSFRKANLEFYQYCNFNVDTPTSNANQKRLINHRAEVYQDYSVFTNTNSTYRQQTFVPSYADFSMNHFTPDLDFYDNNYGIGAGNNIFNGFLGHYPMDRGISDRLRFLSDNPNYNLITMGWDDNVGNGGVTNYLYQEYDAMQYMKSNLDLYGLPASVTPATMDQYYGDYAVYGDRHHMSGAYEFSIPEFISRGKISTTTSIASDFDDNRFNNAQNGQNTTDSFSVTTWQANGQDPRATTGALSDYFEEKSVLDDKPFSTSFEFGYGHSFNRDGIVQKGVNDWANVAMQDLLPTYRYIIDKYDTSGHMVDDSKNNYLGRTINASIVPVNDAYYGANVLTYNGKLAPKEAFTNKLYVSNIASNKTFNITIKNPNQAKAELAVWQNGASHPLSITASAEKQMANGYTQLTFNVPASLTNKVTSFGVKFTNTSSTDINLSSIKIDSMSYDGTASSAHAFTNFLAQTNNVNANGINVKFTDAAYDENTRYFIYDDKNQLVTFSPTPYFHIAIAGKYKIVAENNLGQKFDETTVNIVAAARWSDV